MHASRVRSFWCPSSSSAGTTLHDNPFGFWTYISHVLRVDRQHFTSVPLGQPQVCAAAEAETPCLYMGYQKGARISNRKEKRVGNEFFIIHNVTQSDP